MLQWPASSGQRVICLLAAASLMVAALLAAPQSAQADAIYFTFEGVVDFIRDDAGTAAAAGLFVGFNFSLTYLVDFDLQDLNIRNNGTFWSNPDTATVNSFRAKLLGNGLMTSLGGGIKNGPFHLADAQSGQEHIGVPGNTFIFSGNSNNMTNLFIPAMLSAAAPGLSGVEFSQFAFNNSPDEIFSTVKGSATLAGISKTPPSLSQIPEPATLLLLGPALGWMAWRRRKQALQA